jgi:hypothetical protein
VKILATCLVTAVLGLGLAPPASAKPHNDWCDGCNWGHGSDHWNGGWNNGWYPGQNISVCATGPWRYVTVCLG